MRHRYWMFGLSAALLLLFARAGAAAPARDPDAAPLPNVQIDKSTYMRLRNDQLALLRGMPYDTPYDPRLAAIENMEMNARSLGPFISSSAWTPIGPAPIPNGQTANVSQPVTGRVTAIAVHPANADIVYVGTAQGGVYRSLNGGVTWTPIFDAAASLSIGALALAPSNPTILYVGTGEANLSLDSFFGVGLYRIDNADTAPILNGPINPNPTDDVLGRKCFTGRAISKILVHPNDPATIFVSTSSGYSGLSGDIYQHLPGNIALRGIYRSTNATAGAPAFQKLTVISANNVPPDATGNTLITDMVLDPNNPNTLVCWNYGLPGPAQGGVFRTNNALAGNPAFVQEMADPDANGPDRGALTVSGAGGVTTMMLATELGWAFSNGGSLWRSNDSGITWVYVGNPGFCQPQCWYDIVVSLAPDNANKLLLGGSWFGYGGGASEYTYSTNGGATLNYGFNTGLHADTHAIAIAPSNSSIVYFGCDGGIWRSNDGGLTWLDRNTAGFSATQFQGISVHPIDANFTIGGTQDNGTDFYYPANTWQNIDYGDGGYTVIDSNAPDNANVVMYHTYFNASNYLLGYVRANTTADALAYSWNFFGNGSNGIGVSDNTNFYAPLVGGPGNPNTIYYGTDRLYRSADQGNTNVVVSQAPLSGGTPISAVAISPQNDNVRLVGLNNGQIWGTITGSSVLVNMTGGGMPAKYVGRLTIDPTNANVAYACFNGYAVNAGQHVWKTTNLLSGAPVWAASGNGIPDVPVNALVVDPANPTQLFAGTDIGVYISNDGGANWLPFNTGLPVVAVFGMEIQNPSRTLRIATHGRGMWERLIDTATPTLASIVGSEIVGGHVRLQWNLPGGEGQTVTLYRRPVPGDWSKLGTLNADGSGNVSYEDAAVSAGHSYEYTLGILVNGHEQFAGRVWVDVPLETQLALQRIAPNPAHGDFSVSLVLPNQAPATLELVDLAGRRIDSREVGSMGAGEHQVRFGGSGLAPGTYWVRLQQAGRTFSRRVAVMR